MIHRQFYIRFLLATTQASMVIVGAKLFPFFKRIAATIPLLSGLPLVVINQSLPSNFLLVLPDTAPGLPCPCPRLSSVSVSISLPLPFCVSGSPSLLLGASDFWTFSCISPLCISLAPLAPTACISVTRTTFFAWPGGSIGHNKTPCYCRLLPHTRGRSS